jgi:hypothetical protein
MDHQYSIINQCLQLLKQSDLPTIKKLRVEIQLIQMKRLLLNDTLAKELRFASCGDDVFEGLLSQMQRISRGSSEGDAVGDLMERLSGMLNVLGGEQASN